MPKKFLITKGLVRGEYTVLSDTKHRVNQDGYTYYMCKCSCGKEELVKVGKLFRSGFTSCESCIKKRNYNLYTKAKWDVVRTKYVGELSGTFFSHIKQSASTRGIEFAVTKEELWELLIKQDSKCALTRVPIQLSTARKKSDPDFSQITASLDRIDSEGGYTSGNIQWLHKEVNKMKWTLSNEDFINICRHVVNVHGNTEPSQGNFNSTWKVQRIGVELEESDNTPTKNEHPTPRAG